MNKYTTLVAACTLQLAVYAPGAASAEEAMPPTCQPVTKEQVAALFDRWNAALQTKNADEVVKNYEIGAILLPTVSNKPRTSPEEIKDYFVHFLAKGPKGSIDSHTIEVGCNIAYDVGTYTFELKGPDGKPEKISARYSFIYKFNDKDKQWKIAHHHSSAMPEKPGETH
jgi:uncharacterized protein (TIGR02246 family)